MTSNNTGADAYEEYRRKVIALKEAFFAELRKNSDVEPISRDEMMRIMHERWRKRREEKERGEQNSPDTTA
jgi:hypothetical protein